MPEVRLEGVAKSFGRTETLKGIDLVIADGGFTVLVGPSGCGKTTLLRLIAGLETVSAGRIFIGDREVTELEPKERNVAIVFQNYALYPHMTVYDNMAFGLLPLRLGRAEIDARVRRTAAMLGIDRLLGRKPGQLSGGQQQRVAIGRAVVREPNVFLFDEPLSNLDAKLRVGMRTELLKLHRELTTTTIYVTHDQEEAMTMGDRIVVMAEGAVQQQGSPREIYFHPVNLAVAGLVGSPPMNLITGRLVAGGFEGGGLRLALDGGGEGAGDGKTDGAAVVLGVRPEDVHGVETLPEGRSAGEIDALVEVVELLGSRAIVTMSAGETEFKAVVEERGLGAFREGAPARVAFDRARLHLFDAETGRRLGR